MKQIDKNDYCCDNTWLKNCNNKTFSYRQLLGAMKFGFVKFATMPAHVKTLMSAYLKQEGYIKRK